MLNGSDATESLNPAQCSRPEVMTMAEDPESDNESFGSDTDTVILPQTQTATPDDRPLSETESFDALHMDTFRRQCEVVMGDSGDHPTIMVIGCNWTVHKL